MKESEEFQYNKKENDDKIIDVQKLLEKYDSESRIR
ncbi:unnamed protein product, partial [marine sediment metagenome]